jgi:nickel-dependent lactate racemase
MGTTTVRLPQLAWYENNEFEIQFPDSWEVTTCYMKGHDRPPLNEQGFREAFANPIGTMPIRELARGKNDVVILFDDMSRPTRVAKIIPYVLEELEAAGIKDSSIRFIAAVGTHGALNRIDFAKKLGEEVLSRFPVYNHNPYENCTPLGTTSRGTPLAVNSEFMGCDFKVSVGAILPHYLTGFSGGGKIIMPGVASIDTMFHNHGVIAAESIARGESMETWSTKFETNEFRLDMAEAAEMAGLDVEVDAVLNGRCETTALFVGDPAHAHLEGVKLAREVYATQSIQEQDIAILNTYAKASEAFILPLSWTAKTMLKDKGDMVVISNAPEGQVTHYLAGPSGEKTGGRLWLPRTTLPPNITRFILLTPYVDLAGAAWLAPRESIVWARTWTEALKLLTETYGDSAKVAVIPDATMQYFTW